MSRPAHVLPAPIQSAPLPEVTNHTPWPSQYFQHVDPQDEIFHVLVCRTTYSLRGMRFDSPEPPTPQLIDPVQQAPLCESDAFCGAVNTSSLRQESDYAPYKPRCDVLVVDALAHAPQGQPAQRWPVGFSFGQAIEKTFQVCGPRRRTRQLQWDEPEAAAQVPIRYERAFGGPQLLQAEETLQRLAQDAALSAEQRRQATLALAEIPAHFLPNPIGCGRDPQALARASGQIASITGRSVDVPLLAPQLEALDQPFQGQDDYPVIGLGPLGRWWQPRLALAGTHDERWKATQWPRSPVDHDYRYWNCAPDDQQIDYPQGGELISLLNLTPGGGVVRIRMPTQDLQLLVRLQVGAVMFAPMNIDTVVIDLGQATLSVVRRALVSARTEVRVLELGTWPVGTRLSLPASAEAGDG